MTRTGQIRQAYRAIEEAPSRFTGGSEYEEWAARADTWGDSRYDAWGNRVELSDVIDFWDDWLPSTFAQMKL